MKVLVTGAGGLIGMHCAQRLLERGDEVVGIGNLNDYYDVRLKEARLARLSRARFRFKRLDLADRDEMEQLFTRAAAAGDSSGRGVPMTGLRFFPLQPGDVTETYADVEALARDTGIRPNTPVRVSVRRFVDWYLSYYGRAG